MISSHKSCLERQIGEAVRIQLRGNTLNSVGVYNQSKLTRLVVDSDWDKRVFNSNWKTDKNNIEKADDLSEEGADCLENVPRGKKRSTDTLQNCRKRRKVEVEVELPENKVVWG